MPRPAPRLAPVTTATFPASGFRSVLLMAVSCTLASEELASQSAYRLGRTRNPRHERARADTAERAELVAEVRLVVVAGFDSQPRPWARRRLPQHAQQGVHARQPAPCPRRQADVLGEELL